MSWFDELDEQARLQWHLHTARERLDLSASVEETLIDGPVLEEPELDETGKSQLLSKSSPLIPPRLSLQSRLLPAIAQNAASESSKPLPVPAGQEGESIATGRGNILMRLVQHLSAFLTSIVEMVQLAIHASFVGSPGSSAIERASFARSPGYIEQAMSVIDSDRFYSSVPETPSTHSTEVAPPVQNRQVGGKRTTKVRLQVVPKLEGARNTDELDLSLPEMTSNPGLSAPERQEERARISIHEPRAALTGSGTFESGQCDLAVTDRHVTASSVVVVVLTGDPGPVVVQYVSLQPAKGFTVHLSAPAKNRTPFNYAIL